MPVTDKPMFLTPAQVAELTGIKGGRDGKSRSHCQSVALAKMGIRHYINAVDRVIVARAIIETAVARDSTIVLPHLRGGVRWDLVK